ncbi:MAG: hypothetical protein OEX97_02795 [Acidimicrobiia bacterium]|nr:hypothetical protein [Acidimicrobiia bacterium]
MAEVEIPAEDLSAGPRGHRLHVIDYDASTDTLYAPFQPPTEEDPFPKLDFEQMITDPHFQSWNTYAVVMRTLSRFEFALGRKVAWNHGGHQIKVFPHAFRDANAFYAPEVEALMFGYFQGRDNTIFSCLAHDVIAHETTHAVIDGLRGWFTDPSSLDQAAFHEGFADVVALLEVLSVPEVVKAILEHNWANPDDESDEPNEFVSRYRVTEDKLLQTELFGLAEEMGTELSANRGDALRRSATLKPSKDWATSEAWTEPHRRGEILSAVMLRAFVKVWMARIDRLRRLKYGHFDLGSVALEGAEAAEYLLTTAIRAMDYTPPIHLTFSDYLSALLTADYELRPRIDRYEFRSRLRAAFGEFGIDPAPDADPDTGIWMRELDVEEPRYNYSRSRFEAMQRDPEEVFRFVWENRSQLGLVDDSYTQVSKPLPAVRFAPEDGAVVRETIVEVIQQISVMGRELSDFGVRRPQGMTLDQPVKLSGGSTLIFDEYGRLKYRVRNTLPLPKSDPRHDRGIARLHSTRLEHLWVSGYLDEEGSGSGAQRLREIHLRKAMDDEVTRREQW